VASNSDPRYACGSIAGESYKLWLQHETRTDDITIIIVHIKRSPNVRLNLPLSNVLLLFIYLFIVLESV
jgi:hypothetical protein